MAVLADSKVEAAHGVVDVGGGQEIAGEGVAEFSAEALSFDNLRFGAHAEDAQAGLLRMAKYAAAAGCRDV